MRLPEIDHAIAICETHLNGSNALGTEIEIYLTSYLLVFMGASFEEHIERLVDERASRSADTFLAAFVRSAVNQLFRSLKTSEIAAMSYYRKLWIRCGNEKGGVPFRVGNANPGGSRVEGDATDVEGSREWSWKGSRRAAF